MNRPSAAAGESAVPESRPMPWTIEELRAYARQMQVPDAAAKSRFELIELLGGADRLGAPPTLQ